MGNAFCIKEVYPFVRRISVCPVNNGENNWLLLRDQVPFTDSTHSILKHLNFSIEWSLLYFSFTANPMETMLVMDRMDNF